MHPDFTSKKGWYTPQELGHLATALGFPRNLFTAAFKLEIEVLGETAIKEKTLLDLLNSKALDPKLERTYNRYDAKYNAKLISKSITLLRHRSLTFQELSDARVSFETYACDDGTGMPAELATMQQALKLINRVISPVKLNHEIQKYLDHSEAPYRFQMYEFLDVVPMCETFDHAERRFHRIFHETKGLSTSESNTDVNLPDFGRLLTTTEHQVLAYLDDEYKASLYHKAESCPPVKDEGCVIDSGIRRSLVSVSRDEFSSIMPSIHNSTIQLQLARGGNSPFNEEQHCSLSKLPMPSLSKRHTYSQQKPLSFKFRVHSRAKTTTAHSAMIALHTPRTKADTPTVDFDTLCANSVLKARDTLSSSFALIPSKAPPKVFTLSQAGPAIYAKKARDTSKPYCMEPLISEQDRVIHQGLINDLEWQALHKQTA